MKKTPIIRQLLFLVISFICFVSCETVLNVEEASYDAPTSGLNTEIRLDVNNSWSASSSADWCVITPTQGNKNVKSISLKVKNNYTYDARECTITITSKDKIETIRVSQLQLDVIQAETRLLELSDKEQTFNVVVASNIDYSVNVSDDWIKYVRTKAVTSKTLEFMIEQNNDTKLRTGSICLRQDGGIESFIVVQQKQRDYISTSSNRIDFDWEKASTSIPVTSNVNFDVIVPDDCPWLHAEKNDNGQTTDLLINADDYIPTPSTVTGPSVSDRVGTITLQYGELSEVITVNQQHRDYIWVSPESITLYEGNDEKISAIPYLHSNINKALTWYSTNEEVAIVTDGVITGISKGSASIIITNADNSVSLSIPVIVKKVTDDIRVVAQGKSMVVTSSLVSMVFHANLHWPSQVKSIKFLSVWLCNSNGTAYDIKGTSDGYVTFNPVHYYGSYSTSVSLYYSTWFVLYQVEIDGEVCQFAANLDTSVWSSAIP